VTVSFSKRVLSSVSVEYSSGPWHGFHILITRT